MWLYERELEYILRRFGSRQLNQLKPLEIQAWLADLLAGGMAPSSVNRKYGVLRRLLQVAVNKGLIARSPCAGVEPPRVETNEMRFLRPGEVVALADAIDPWFRPLVYTAVETGMRWSELVGLRRSGVDLLRRTIAVTEQLVYIGGDLGAGRAGRWVRQKPKTRAGIRSISISAFLAEQLEEQLTGRSQPGRDGLVFTNMRGAPIGGSIFNKRHWQPACTAVGLTPSQVSRPSPYGGGSRGCPRSTPQGHPAPHGSFHHQHDTRPLRPSLPRAGSDGRERRRRNLAGGLTRRKHRKHS